MTAELRTDLVATIETQGEELPALYKKLIGVAELLETAARMCYIHHQNPCYKQLELRPLDDPAKRTPLLEKLRILPQSGRVL